MTYANYIQESGLPDEIHITYDVEFIRETLTKLGFYKHWMGDFTAMASIEAEGQFQAIWLTNAQKPYLTNPVYQPLSFFITDSVRAQKPLPIVWDQTNNEWYKK